MKGCSYYFYLAGKAWRNKTKEYLQFLAGMAVTTAFLAGLFILHYSVQRMYYQDQCQNDGSYHIQMHLLDQEECSQVEAVDGVEKIGFGTAVSGRSIGEFRLESVYYDCNAMEQIPIPLERGCLPSDPSEVALSTQIQIDGEYISGVYALGDTVEITDESGNVKAYTLSGILDDFDAGRSAGDNHAAVFFMEGTETGRMYDAYVRLEKSNAYHHILNLADVLGVGSEDIVEYSKSLHPDEAKIVINDMVLEYDRADFFYTFHSSLLVLMNILILMVLIASVVLLANRNIIMIRKRRKELAVFKMQGFGTGNLLLLVSLENLLPGVVGIALGEGAGVLLGEFIVWLISRLRVSAFENMSFSFGGSGVLWTVALMLAALVVINLAPALSILMLSPVEAFGSSAGRNKRTGVSKIVLMTVSIGLVSSILILILYFLQTVSLKLQPDGTAQYYFLTDTNTKLADEDYVAELFPEAEKITIYYYAMPEWEMRLTDFEDSDWLNPEVYGCLDDLFKEVYFPGGSTSLVNVEAVSRKDYEERIASMAVTELPDYDELLEKNGCILADNFCYEEDGEERSTRILYHTQTGDMLNYSFTQGSGSFTVMGIMQVAKNPYSTQDTLLDANIYCVIPQENYIKLFPEPYRVFAKLDAADENIRALGENLNANATRYGYTPSDNVERIRKEYDTNMITLIGFAMTAVFLCVTGAVCIAQIKAADILSRKEDFEILADIGMTRGQMHGMLAMEDLGYSIWGVMLGTVIFAVISRFYRVGEGTVIYKAALSVFPVFVLVFAVCTCYGYVESRKIKL